MTAVDARLAGDSWGMLGFYRFARALVALFCRLWFRMSVEGREHVPASGPYIVAPVHRSNLDTPITGAAVSRRRVRFMGKDSLWKPKAASWFLSALGGFPVTRGTADREALERSMEVLRRGEPLVLFPEGTRQFGPLVQPLFDGAAYLACKCQVPILPVGIGGSERAMRKGSKLIRPVKVHVIIGEPLVPPPLTASGRVPRPEVRALTATLHERLQALFDAAQVRAGA